MIVVVLALLLALMLAAIWGLGLFFGWALATKVALTVLVVALALGALVVRYLLKLRAAARLAKATLAPAPATGDAHEQRRQDLAELEQRSGRALAALRRTRLGSGKSAFYSLPWYVIIGPPGAGKTTALLHSGLEFPLEKNGLASKFRGAAGTRNCDWWFSSEGIFLDTAGRYTTQDDQTEWFAFLDVLRKNRPRQPLNGLIVALPLTELLGASPEQRAILAARVRARMDEITTRLQTLVPVYVLVTKMDLVAGFTEFWADLRASERGCVWGMTFPMGDGTDPAALIPMEFDGLVSRLLARMKRRLASEPSSHCRRALATFPAELARVRDAISSVVTEIFKRNAFQELPPLRGLYLTSGTQNAEPSSVLATALAKSLGARLPAPSARPVERRSYFLTDVFRRVMFPDRDVAGRTAGAESRSTLFRVAIASSALFFSVMLIVPGAITWSRNWDLAHAVAATSRQVGSTDWSTTADLEGKARLLDDVRARLSELDEWRSRGAPVQLRWGMYSGERLLGGLRDLYAAALARAVVTPVRRELEDRLRSLDGGPVRTSENFNRDFDLLKLYLMLGDAAHVDAAWAAPRIVRIWSQLSHVPPAKEDLIMGAVTYELELQARGEIPPGRVEPALVRRARSLLGQVPQMDRLYESLVRDANTEIAPLSRESVFYGAVGPFVMSRTGAKVAGAYTAQGWARVRALLGAEKSRLEAEAWVLGDGPGAGAEDLTAQLRSLYFDRYRAAWRDFLGDLAVRDPENAEVAIEELNAFAEPEWPYLRLVRTLRENVALDMGDEGIVDRVADLVDAGALKARPRTSPIEKAFRPILRFGLPPESARDADSPPPTGLSQYEAQLQKVIGALTDLRDGDNQSDPRKMGDVFQDAFRATTALLSDQDDFTRPLLTPLLMAPITLAWKRVAHDAGASAGASWESSVYQAWHTRLEGRYPFASSQVDVPLDDFLDFFGRSGALWSFYEESLKPTLDHRGGAFVPSRRFKSAIGYTGEFLDTCLKRGEQITNVFFPPKGDGAAVVFDVNLHSVSPSIGEVTLVVDGVAHTYRNEPEQWIRVTWPGPGAHGAQLQVRGAGGLSETIARPGDWGLFRLLDGATVEPGRAGGNREGTPTIVATWQLSGSRDHGSVSLDLRPSRAENPFVRDFFRNYTCPSAITSP